ncbi:MAG: hemerythrin domain-containing protein [Planctomycetota bacterium]
MQVLPKFCGLAGFQPASLVQNSLETAAVTENTTSMLLVEHGLCRHALDLLARAAEQVALGLEFPSGCVAELLQFFREFERWHHRREDEVVVPLALAHASDQEAEAIGSLIADREASQELLYALMLFWEPADLREEERSGFVDTVRTFADRMRREMQLEERLLYPLADWVSEDEREQARVQLDAIDRSGPGHAVWADRLRALDA